MCTYKYDDAFKYCSVGAKTEGNDPWWHRPSIVLVVSEKLMNTGQLSIMEAVLMFAC